MRETLNLVCNMVMAICLFLLVMVGFVLIIVICYEMVFKLIEVVESISHIFWWTILSLIGAFLISMVITIFNTKKNNNEF